MTNPSEATAAGELPDLPIGLTSFGAAIVGHLVYVYGGNTGTAHGYDREVQSDRLLVLDLDAPETGWTNVGHVPRRQGLALVAHGGMLYRVGGFEARNAPGEEEDLHSTQEFERFDPTTGTWEGLADLPEPRSSHDAVVCGDHLYVVGGWSLGGDPVWSDSALVADLSADPIRWERLPDPPFRRRALAVGEVDGKLYVIGGMQQEGGPTPKVDVYDPATRTWSDGPPVECEGEMGGFGAAAFRVGEHLYVTTYEGRLQRLTAAGWRTIGELRHARFFHRMLPLPLPGERLLVLGGASMQTGKVTASEVLELPA